MEKEPTLGNSPVENSPEYKDRFMELMEMRHRNAMTALKIERILAQEEQSDEYPTTRTPENIRVKKEAHEALEPILESLSSAGLTRKAEHVKEVVDGYFVSKITAQRAELELKEKLKEEGKEPTPQGIGSELFRQRTGVNPKKPVEGVRREGYFILAFFNDDDYLKFVEGLDRDESAGLFHRAMRFPNMTVDVVLSRHGFGNRTILHERQHFINDSILQDFTGIESRNIPSKKEFPLLAEGVNEQRAGVRKGLGGTKDELLARIRDGSDSVRATDFLGTDLYEYLSDEFSEDEQKEVSLLLKKIESELKSALGLFADNQSRGMLVYHLVDIPLLRFPERIKAITEYYNSKISEFTNFIPDENEEKQIQDKDTKRRLAELRLDITGDAYSVSDMILSSSFGRIEMNYDELQTKLKDVRIKLEDLRKNYYNLLAESRPE
ncbi:hypothetical protein A3B85_02050 [Candidatus Nomurabacteria bacterium RIFCSPHIGHO2_02_FULL_37_13]|uniref:Uncharacterized protein n=1 Tax=Candidatus Nomurabacteria bacterium RIFCSPHIGHO2_02_FULL_37_13 TaxID=1801750 RepID=A0A1F6W5L5_9BACT|nr:MAG: hypothetical protein A3B85_02050 [Candidatus Nomurabacteria bacterium RIFCSPHIGHO2_02_FULL_37_13]OGI88439.1 MAG: hypothetical protein A2906_00845 [Candidatus Nomurabacteria bacterium RIFCSPLOWO2_01_FULL_37_25]